MDHVKCNAIVLSEVQYGEADKMLTCFSDEFGKISVSAKGAKKSNSRFLSISQQFCYSKMELSYAKNGIYTLCDGELINSFYDLRNDLDVLFTANDIVNITKIVSQEENPDEELLKLTLNTLLFLTGKDRNLSLVKDIFKIRLVYEEGCLEEPSHLKPATIRAVDHIITSDYKYLFNFNVADNILLELNKFADKSMKNLLE